ncbi:hypothetical protein HDV00_008361 [Rhizophlyctis rosea]|nr:hypothetical protein HDV00_008361 [Rhizophlyctis rosea]
MKVILATIAVLASSLSVASAWGTEGHQVVGRVATSLVKSTTATKIASILNSGETMENTASWADSVKSARGNGAWHYIDVNTNADPSLDPTNSGGTCIPNMTRDCSGTGLSECIVKVISDQGDILKGVCSSSTATTAQYEALKYLVHFFGDITQPLHACGWHTGGNGDPVAAFDSQTKTSYGALELHWIWDTSILLKTMGGTTTASGQTVTQTQIDTYANNLVTRIQSGDLASQATSWKTCTSPDAGTVHRCPLEWAGDSNSFDCTAVYADYSSTANLGSTYYSRHYLLHDGGVLGGGTGVDEDFVTNHADTDLIHIFLTIPTSNTQPLVDTQIAKAAVRLAAYLDEVLACTPTTTTASTTTTKTVTTTVPSPTPTATAPCTNPTFPNFYYVHTQDGCCNDGHYTGTEWSYKCCFGTGPTTGPYTDCGSTGSGYQRYSSPTPFPPGI